MIELDDALDGMDADLQERCPGMGQAGAQEVVGKLALILTGQCMLTIPSQNKREPMSAGRFAALVAEWLERRADGTAFVPRKLKAHVDGAYRRIGYGRVNGRKRV